MAIGVKQQQRRGTAAEWNTSNHVLDEGELGVTTDTGIIKIGDGVNGWNDLPVAFDSDYLPILGKAADSELLDGIDSSGYLKVGDATTTATADKVAKRTADGRILSADGTDGLEVVNYSQLTAGIASAKRFTNPRTVTADFTVAASDVGGVIFVNGSSWSTTIVGTIPTNAAVPITVGSVIEFRTSTSAKSPLSVVGAGGVTVTGSTLIYGQGSTMRLGKTATDTWLVLSVNQSPGPILRRKVKVGSGGQTLGAGFTKIRLDGANAGTHTNNADTLGTNEQYDAAVDIYKCYIRRSGWYDVQGQLTLNEAIGGRAYTTLYINGVSVPVGSGGPKGSVLDTGYRFSDLLPFNVGDYIEMYGFQEAGGSATIVNTNDSPSYFAWAWRRPL